MQNKSMPASTIIPVLGCKDLNATIEWLTRVYQFTQRWHAGGHRAQLSFNGGAIAITQQNISILQTCLSG